VVECAARKVMSRPFPEEPVPWPAMDGIIAPPHCFWLPALKSHFFSLALFDHKRAALAPSNHDVLSLSNLR
jgi:hypothetical protein